MGLFPVKALSLVFEAEKLLTQDTALPHLLNGLILAHKKMLEMPSQLSRATDLNAEDWFTGVRLTSTSLGSAHSLEIHHIFPKAVVRKDYKKRDINEIANLAFLSLKANRKILKTEPGIYLSEIEKRNPALLKNQFVPPDKSLWALDRFEDFLFERRKLLAEGINSYINSLAN